MRVCSYRTIRRSLTIYRSVTFCGLLALATNAGCGLKGPLYLPTAEQQRETAEREAALAERERREHGEQPAVEATPAPSPEPNRELDQAPSQPSPSAAPTN
jgi:predicted small lipoprotein YifL